MAWQNYFTPKQIVKYLLVLLGISLIVVFHKSIVTTLVPFFAGLLLAALLEPFISLLQSSLKLPRGIAVMSIIIITVLILSYILFAFTTKMISELIDFVSRFPQYQQTITTIISDTVLKFEIFNESLPEDVRDSITSNLNSVFNTLKLWLENLVKNVLNAFAKLPTFLLVTIITIVAAYFFSKDKVLIINSFISLVPEKWKPQVNMVFEKVAIDMMGFIKGKFILLLLSTTIAAVGLILLNTRYWLILAILIGILDIIPSVGPGIVFTPWVFFTFLLGDPKRAILLIILYFVIFATRQFLEPKIISSSVGIHPLVMLLAIYGGYIFFGVFGIFIGPILAIIFKAAINADIFKPTSFPE